MTPGKRGHARRYLNEDNEKLYFRLDMHQEEKYMSASKIAGRVKLLS
jgi:hypothetical protein